VSDREEVLADLRERARYYATLSEVGLPPRPPGSPAPASSDYDHATAPGSPDLRPATAPAGATSAHARAAAAADTRGAAGADTQDAAAALVAVREDIGDCQRCKLAPSRRNIVFGQGHPNARLMFVGEAPGADEDEQGLAFVGKAGQLLTRIIESIGLKREDVFIANVLKCRPPQNRNPEADEILSCQPFLERQIAAIRPRVLVGLGKFAGQWLLKTAEPISRIRGRIGDYDGIKVIPTYHPAYLLRNPGAKKEVWEDMKVVRDILKD
jgi:uracil-DNA glycosylase